MGKVESLACISVMLTWAEAAMASEVGRRRQLKSLAKARQDQHGYAGLGWAEHIEGACGELAVAKVLNLYWDGSVDTFKRCDLHGIQVRTRSKDDWDLIVRADDDPSAAYVLVTGKCPSYVVRGWIAGADAKNPTWLRAHGGREEAYFVPQSELRPLFELERRDGGSR